LLLDLGTGLRTIGTQLTANRRGPGDRLAANVLLTHLHFDHVLGLPFFGPLLLSGVLLDVYGPRPDGGTLADAMANLFRPPFFPVGLKELGGSVTFHEVNDDDFTVGSAKVRARRVPHLGTTLGFRVEDAGRSIAYVPDHQAPRSLSSVATPVLELADQADLLVHDAQFTDLEFARKWNWGHSTPGYAVKVASQAAARRVLLFHHDPSHHDAGVAHLEEQARRLGEAEGILDVSSARENVIIEVGKQ
jgi:phosphoribosyl 1,2-cyclic phosphodiesterase